MDAGIAVAAIVAVALVYVLLPVTMETFLRFRVPRGLQCPETGTSAAVGVDAPWAAFTAAFCPPRLRVKNCSLWPERKACGERCLAPAGSSGLRNYQPL